MRERAKAAAQSVDRDPDTGKMHRLEAAAVSKRDKKQAKPKAREKVAKISGVFERKVRQAFL
jgi:hypothetical protein